MSFLRRTCWFIPALVIASPALAKDEGPKPVPWSFAPLRQVDLPPVKDKTWPRTRMDHFILARLEAAGLKPAVRADERTLSRRLAFDLTGLPPKEDAETRRHGDTETRRRGDAEHQANEPLSVSSLSASPRLSSDNSSRLDYQKQVESLLSSPHYGERWARHWLDLARYTDRTPDWLDSTKFAYLYRDWVVGALNGDMAYDQFVMRQIAADYLPGSRPQDRVAMGFIGLSPTYFKELQLPPEIIKTTVADEWEEHVDAVGRTFLGLTLACARCHDHKSDPVTAQDYYALAGVFASVKQVELPTMDDRFWKPVEKARGTVAQLEKELAALKKKKPKDLAEQTKQIQERMDGIKTSTPHYQMVMANAVVDAALYVVEADSKKGTKLDYKMGMARDLELQKRGNPNDTGDAVPRRFLSAFPTKSGQPRQFSSGSGRLELAQAIVEDAAPLTARVIVNRVWKHHFGRGLVDTPSEFGNLGEVPTHPELLDDLAGRFIANGWSLKWLHREILNSATWQQSSVAPENERRDPENKFFARMVRRRLDWESWRDTLLTATGEIDLHQGGPADSIGDAKNFRRSLYGASDRQDMDPMLRIHDVPDPGAHSPWRTETITPLQGLFALNSPFMQERADVLGKWMQAQGAGYLGRTYERLFTRPATERETRAAQAFLSGREADAAVWSQYAQALLATNEMLFVD